MDLLAFVGLIVILYYLFCLLYPFFSDCDMRLMFQEKFGKPIDTLKGKVVWITGASSGIGEHLAYILAEAGCKLALSARREAELQRVKNACLTTNKSLTESDIQVYAFDICDADVQQKTFNEIINHFGKLDILVNNAGRSQRAEWENIDVAVDKAMFELNVFSQISLSRLVVKYFLEKNSGHIVYTSSFAGLYPTPYSATYCGTKHALHGYFNTFILEKYNRAKVKVTAVCPGPVQTNFLSECFTDKPGEKFGKKTEVASNKVSVDRCASLMGVAIANDMQEVWIAKTPCLVLWYLAYTFPNIGPWIIKQLGVLYLQKLRDAKVTVLEKQ